MRSRMSVCGKRVIDIDLTALKSMQLIKEERSVTDTLYSRDSRKSLLHGPSQEVMLIWAGENKGELR